MIYKYTKYGCINGYSYVCCSNLIILIYRELRLLLNKPHDNLTPCPSSRAGEVE